MPDDWVGIGKNGAMPEPEECQRLKEDRLGMKSTPISELRIFFHVSWAKTFVRKLRVQQYQKQCRNSLLSRPCRSKE